MNLDEAIRLKQLTGDEFLAADPDDLDAAELLSIEALKDINAIRATFLLIDFGILPGETKE